MSDPVETAPKPPARVPGPVIFVAMMDFISVSFVALISLIALIGLIFGNVMGLYDFVTRQMTQYAPSPNFSYGITFLFGAVLAASLSFVLFFVLLGIGLLKGKSAAWYCQIAMCVLGLFAFPFGTILNGAILFLFFRQPVRDFFKV